MRLLNSWDRRAGQVARSLPLSVALLNFAGGAEVAEVGADAACSTGDGQGAGWELEVGRLLGSYYRGF